MKRRSRVCSRYSCVAAGMTEVLSISDERFKEAIDRENQFEALLTDLWKVFHCIDQKLLIATFYE